MKKKQEKFDPLCSDCGHKKSKHKAVFNGYPDKLLCWVKEKKHVCSCDEFMINNLEYLEQLYESRTK